MAAKLTEERKGCRWLLFLLACSGLFMFSLFYWYVASADTTQHLMYYEIVGDSKICYYGPNGPTIIIKSYQTCPRTA